MTSHYTYKYCAQGEPYGKVETNLKVFDDNSPSFSHFSEDIGFQSHIFLDYLPIIIT